MDKADSTIKFHCNNCGQKIRVPQIHAGKKGRCPKCKSIVVVPTLKQIPGQNAEASIQPGKEEGVFEKHLEEPQEPEGETAAEETEPAGKRKLPWFIDIFLYPISVSGIIHLAIFLIAPLLINKFVFIDFYNIIRMALYMFFIGYFFYYLGHCVFDSSKGGCRAPDISLQSTPGAGDLISQIFLILGCVAVCFCPAALYYIFTERIDLTFWLLSACGIFFLPMVFLKAVMFDSVNALNPILIISSLFITFFPYCGLVLVFCVLGGLVAPIISNLPKPGSLRGVVNYVSSILDYLLGTAFIYQKMAFIYLAMVATHLLGRFYWLHKDKLGWGL